MDRAGWTGLFLALVVSAVGGFGGAALGIPAGWFTGGMVAVAVAGIAGVKVSMPARLIDAATVMIGVVLGAGVTPEVVAGIAKWPVSLAILAVSVVVCQIATQRFLMRFGGWDSATAYFAALPGAMMYALVGATETKADLRRVAINQLTRVFLLIALLPTIATMVEPGSDPVQRVVATPLNCLILVAVSVPCALLFRYFRVPVGLMTGALLGSAFLHGSGLVEGTFPEPVLIAAFIILGASVGVRFAGTSIRYIAENAGPVFGAFVVGVVVSFAFAYLVTLAIDVPLDQLVISFAPGGVDAMIAVALAMHMDSAFVAAHQIARLMGVVVFGPLGAKLALGRETKGRPEIPRD